jgi:hypothetical protein
MSPALFTVKPERDASTDASRRWLSAMAVVLSVGLMWLVVLPWLGRQKPIRQHVDALHAADINASAMFYSELECRYMLRK